MIQYFNFKNGVWICKKCGKQVNQGMIYFMNHLEECKPYPFTTRIVFPDTAPSPTAERRSAAPSE